MPQNFPRSLRAYAQAGLFLCLCFFSPNNPSPEIYAQASTNSYAQKIRTFHSAEEFARLTHGKVKIDRSAEYEPSFGGLLIGTDGGVILKARNGKMAPFPGKHLLPQQNITVIAQEEPGRFWFGTMKGATLYEEYSNFSKVEYFAGNRWLSDDKVTG
ncbi:MAG: hypothetical protein L0220_19805, partial [Acidobacteria bacterium]|nr:hypothetical protein [Acidobacteriota bacterium]